MTLGSTVTANIATNTSNSISDITLALTVQAGVSSTTHSIGASVEAALKSQIQVFASTANSTASIAVANKSSSTLLSTTQNSTGVFTLFVADPPSIVIDSVTENVNGYLDIDWVLSAEVGSITDSSTSSCILDLFEPYVASNMYTVEKQVRVFNKENDIRNYSVQQEDRLFTVLPIETSFTVEPQVRKIAV